MGDLCKFIPFCPFSCAGAAFFYGLAPWGIIPYPIGKEKSPVGRKTSLRRGEFCQNLPIDTGFSRWTVFSQVSGGKVVLFCPFAKRNPRRVIFPAGRMSDLWFSFPAETVCPDGSAPPAIGRLRSRGDRAQFPVFFPVQAGSSLRCQPVSSFSHRVVPSQATPSCSQGITSVPVSSSRPQASPWRTAT